MRRATFEFYFQKNLYTKGILDVKSFGMIPASNMLFLINVV